MPKGLEFDFIEVDQDDGEDEEESKEEVTVGISQQHGNKEDEASGEEFDFPLFAAPIEQETAEDGVKIMKISLREDIVENIKNERPESYYFAIYSEDDKRKFQQAAITAEDLYKEISISVPLYNQQPWKILDLNSYNASVERELARQKHRNRGCRAGKKKRACKIECKQRKLERMKVEKKIKKEHQQKEKKKFYKQKTFKRKAPALVPAAKKPKYRTE